MASASPVSLFLLLFLWWWHYIDNYGNSNGNEDDSECGWCISHFSSFFFIFYSDDLLCSLILTPLSSLPLVVTPLPSISLPLIFLPSPFHLLVTPACTVMIWAMCKPTQEGQRKVGEGLWVGLCPCGYSQHVNWHVGKAVRCDSGSMKEKPACSMNLVSFF